jgi:integrative and conjugative element protein (TIGR02256 family)
MQLLLTQPVVKNLRLELRRAGRREIGGLLMGEHVRDEVFRVVSISIQRSGGSQTCFIRQPQEHEAQLKEFFARTGADYARFNYLGEWHSHPSFEPVPSDTDVRTMQSIVDDPIVGVNFLMLMIPRLGKGGRLELSAMTVRRGWPPSPALVSTEQEEAQPEGIALRCLRRILRL